MLLAAGLLAGGCGGEGFGGGNARKGGSLTIGWATPPDSLDPALAAAPESLEALWLVYTPPLTYKHAQGRAGTTLIPALAERMPQVSADGRTYSFRLRRGLHYSGGARVRASDFEHAVSRVERVGSPLRRFYNDVAAISTDDRTREVTIRLRRPDATFSNVLALPSSAPVPGRTPYTRQDRQPPPGVGPYVIARRYGDGGFLMRRRRRFHVQGVPGGNVDEIRVRPGGTAAARARAVVAGRLDYMQDAPPTALLPELRSKYEDRYHEYPTGATLYYLMNPRRSPFDSRRVRQAVSYAVDGDKLRRLSEGRLEPSCNFLPQDVPGYKRLAPCPYGERTAAPNLEKARALVEKSGVQKSRVVAWGPAGGNGPRLTRYYAHTLGKLGLDGRPKVAASTPERAATALAVQAGDLPAPANYFSALAGLDRRLDVRVRRLRRRPRPSEEDWAALDKLVVERAYVAPVGSLRRGMFLSERLDSRNCARFHPVYGSDYSSFCLK